MIMTKCMTRDDLKGLIRDIPDFPKKGIIFKDIMPLIQNKEAFKCAIDLIADRYAGKGISQVVGVEARGFIFGAAVAYKLGAGIVPVRKKGKLPYKTHEVTYDLEYGTDTLQMHQDAIVPGEKVLIVDDLLATGGTIGAVTDLVKKLDGDIVEIAFLIELTFLKGKERLKDFPTFSLIQF